MQKIHLRFFGALLAVLLFTILVPMINTPVQASASGIVISQVYGGGGNSGSVYRNDFVELFNAGNQAVDIANWSLAHFSAANSTGATLTLPNFVLQPGQYFLTQQVGGALGTENLPTPDATGTLAMNSVTGRVDLLDQNSNLVDRVGFGNSTLTFEGSGPTADLSVTNSARRNDNGCTDTDNNNADFTIGTAYPNARNSSTPLNPCSSGDPFAYGYTSGTGPATANVNQAETYTFVLAHSGTIDLPDVGAFFSVVDEPQQNTITSAVFSNVQATAGADCNIVPQSGVSCEIATFVAGTSYTFTMDITFAIAQNVNVLAQSGGPADNNLADNTRAIPVTVIDPQTVCESPFTPIYTIQGSGATSPVSGSILTTQGVVVGDFQPTSPNGIGGYYIQDATGDGNASTSDGIYVNDSTTAVTAGQVVRITGTVAETFGQTRINPTETIDCGTATSPITPTVVSLPIANLADWERYEGMLITVNAADTNPLTVTETFNLGRFGEISVSSGGRLFIPTNYVTPGAAAVAEAELNTRRRLLIDDGRDGNPPDGTVPFIPTTATAFRQGYTTPSITGVLGFGFSNYRLQPTTPPVWTAANPRPTNVPTVDGRITVASFNVLNYFNGDGFGGGFPTSRGADTVGEFSRQTDKIVAALITMDADIVVLNEIENDGPTGYIALEQLIDRLNTAAGVFRYDFIRTGVVGTDEIRVAIIFNRDNVQPVNDFAILDNVAPFNDNTRPAVAQTFREIATDETFTVVGNHFKSKGGCPTSGPDTDQGDGQSCWNPTRVLAANELVNWLNTDPTNSNDPDFLIIGDLNSYMMEDPITTLTANGYTNLFFSNDYSYTFFGESGSLDHALASTTLATQVGSVATWHINADEPRNRDYNDNVVNGDENPDGRESNQAYLYEPNAFRSSDHDPLIVGLNLDTSVPAPGSFTLSTPTTGSSYTLPTVPTKFTWSAATNADSYTLTINNGTTDVVEQTGILNTSYTLDTTQESALVAGSYTWTVSAVNTGGNTPASNAPFTFTISEAPGQLGTFVLSSPANGTNFTDVSNLIEITWTASANATSYNLVVTQNSTVPPAVVINTNVSPPCNNGTCTFVVNAATQALLTDGSYTWGVVATNGTDTLPASNAPFTFSIGDSAPTLGEFALSSPQNGSTISDISTLTAFTWTESTNATSYALAVARTSDAPPTEIIATVVADTACTSGTCTYPLNAALQALFTNGVYSWSVFANDGTATLGASNAPFTFSVAETIVSPMPFNLLSPANGELISDTTELSQITWEATDANSYDFLLLQLSSNSRVSEVLRWEGRTPVSDPDELTCNTTICTLSIPPSVTGSLTDGTYSWTVLANVPGESLEASNAPYFFIIDTQPRQLLTNTGFEDNPDGILGTPDGWTRSNSSRDRVRCDATLANTGNCYYEFRPSATEDSRLVQNAALDGLGAGDVLDFSAFVNAPTTGAVRIRVIVTYMDLTIPRTRLTILIPDGSPTDVYSEYTGQLTLASEPRRIKVQIQNRSTSGRVYVDDVTLTANANAVTLQNSSGDLLPLP